ncbi:MAG TPA: AAA family ATPase [Bacteroidia bacterium]|jgi:SpoVK/Ycf46/Vps4 family AAA+-type ATPase|nr:AAA family ATPase [Bacteroidia bacterium]
MDKKYKFKSLNIYSSDEWMANATKRYRTVFEKAETTYIRVELAFYNKLFDEEDWDCKIELKCVQVEGTKRTDLANLASSHKISKDDNIFYLRDGWGNATAGAFWKKGHYQWEAYIDGQLAGTQIFYVNDVGLVQRGVNPYFTINHIKLFTGATDGWKTAKDKRKYLTKINGKDTQYLWLEMDIKNLTQLDYRYEIIFNYYDDAGQHKAQTSRAGFIDADRKDFCYTFDVGWGHDIAGSWADDKYTLEVVFMDVLVGAVTFDCGADEVEGVPSLINTHDAALAMANNVGTQTNTTGKDSNADDKTLDQLLEELNMLIGLDSVKKSIQENITFLNFSKLRKEKGFHDSGNMSLHGVFTGNPGTGKTTIVKMLGRIYKKMGLISKGHIIEADRASLIGEFIGQTAPRTKKAIDQARGGILFIDEAYALARGDDDSKDFGKEAIEVLLKEMSDGVGDIAIICAGYPKQMEIFIDSNPGLKSRFSNYFHFDDYLPEELFAIAQYAAQNKEVKFSLEAENFLREELINVYRKRDESFGNARYVHAVVEESKMNMGSRLMKNPELDKLSNDDLQTISLADMKTVFTHAEGKKLHLKINDKHLASALAELNALTGLDNIKQEVNELVKLIKFYNETGKDVINKFSLHSVFTGNPGTGKTTVARIMANIYKSLGIIERGHLVETDREGLVAGYVGQTAVKTKEIIDEAMGGVLFIDEAYALSEGGGNDFGKEAIEVLLKRMEDNRGKFAVIAAGYSDNMSRFIEMNPGLKSRFDKVYRFTDYSPEQLWEIATGLFKKEGLVPDEAATAHLKAHLIYLYDGRDKYFGNARTVRQIVGDAVKHQNLRMAGMDANLRSAKDMETLTLEDVKHLRNEANDDDRPKLGFRLGGN